MSFFTRIFGGDAKKTEEKPVEKKEDLDLKKKLEREKVKNNIQKQISDFDDKEKKFEAKVNTLKQKAKEYIAEGKQKQGRKYLAEATMVNKQIEQVIVNKKAVLENINLLQNADMTAEIAKILEETKVHLDEHQKNSDKVLDLIQEMNLRKKEQEQIHEQMKMLVENDEDKEAEDEMLNEIMQEIKREKAKQQKVVPGKVVGVKVPEQIVKPVQQRDEIEDILQGF